jgi:AcrR family transcriptional regulator
VKLVHVPRVRLAQVVRKLPRHAHDLTRASVASSQRWRLLEAMIETTAKLGYAGTSVADVIARAGVSRKAFYEHFSDKEDCFLAAYDVLADRMIAELVAVGAPTAAARRRAQVERFLAELARNPAGARVFMVDVLGAGERALRRREQVNQRFATALFGDAGVDDVRRLAVVGGVNTAVASALLAGRGAALGELAESLVGFVQAALARR